MFGNHFKELEDQLPTLSGQAFAEARKQVLDSGQSILVSRNEIIYERFPNGRLEERKRITPPSKVVRGNLLQIKKR